MTVDVILVAITLLSAIIGTLTNPPKWVKATIITLAMLAGIASVAKSYIDDTDKSFIKQALAASLRPSESQAALFADATFAAIQDSNCTYSQYMKNEDGLAVFCYQFSPTKTAKIPLPSVSMTKVIILRNGDLSAMMANSLEQSFVDQMSLLVPPVVARMVGINPVRQSTLRNTDLAAKIARRTYNSDDDDQPTRIREELGILGETVFRYVTGLEPAGFTFDDNRGVRISYDAKGEIGELMVNADELAEIADGQPETEVLTRVADRFRAESLARFP